MPMRDEFATCPIDGTALDPEGPKLTCRQCTGAMVPEADVAKVIAEIKHTQPEALSLEPPRDSESARTCPCCTEQMTKHMLHGIQIDRCEQHGIWFDPEEMQRILNEVGLGTVPKMELYEKIMAGGFGAAFIAINVIRFIWFFPR